MKVYGIGGLGVDESIFSELQLHFEITPLKWIFPEPGESLHNYAIRFSKQIDTTAPFSLIGISFGGMLALELNKIFSAEKLLLISSATNKKDIPLLFRIAGKSGMLKLLPNVLLKPPAVLTNYFFGVTEPKYKETLKQIIADTDTHFLRWAIHQIVHWENSDVPDNLIRFHGTADRILKCTNVRDVISVSDAGHFMIMNRSSEMSRLLNDVFH